MGIHGIYKEIGPGRRVALSRLAVEKFEQAGRPLRIAIDTSIWLFQIQASKGGTNPALRTFYYRLLRLVALAIHPVFVFDGPNKPPFKRHKRTGPSVASIPEFLAKQLLKQFGYPIHLAPGEAEAECALLQRAGIVDVVLSEDVDTLMFGSGITIRNWSPEKSGNTPTHVNVYDAVETKNGPSALDREGMILVALMSGGDYVPEGIPGCGPKTACEAAKAGFGSELCLIPKNDARAMSEWRARLSHELRTNEGKLFKRKHGALKIPDDFPRLDILGYYTHPAISSQSGLDRLRSSINWDQNLDLPGLRDFTHDAFDWTKLGGAKHFIRSLAPSLLVRQLRIRAHPIPTADLQAIQEHEALLIKGIHGKRQHPVTDNSTELRVSFTPIELVRIDLDKEEPDDDLELPPPGSQLNELDLDDDLPLDPEDEGPKKRGPTKFDPYKAARIWVMESFVKVGAPLTVEDWEAARQIKLKPKRPATAPEPSKALPKAKAGAKRTTKATADRLQAPISQFAKVTKPRENLTCALAKAQEMDRHLHLPASQPTSRPRRDVIDLLSSSPVQGHGDTPAHQQDRAKSPSPALVDLPASVTKRRRRAPMQRSRTLPADASTILSRPTTPPLLDTIETLDLVDEPGLPEPFRVSPPKTRMQRSKDVQPTRVPRGTTVTASPSKAKQTTLDAWRASITPTKSRDTNLVVDISPILAPIVLRRAATDDVESLDLTLSSPLQPTPLQNESGVQANSRPAASISTARPPPTSRCSDASRSSTSSTSSTTTSRAKRKDASTPPQTRRISPRLHRTISSPSQIDTLDLTSPHLETNTHIPREIDTLDLTELPPPRPHAHPAPPIPCTLTPSPPPPEPRRSPRDHTSTIPALPASTSPPAAWKARGKKKRQIILRESVAGAWDFVDVESPGGGVGEGALKGKGKERRRWRESEVEVLDFT